MPAWGEFAGLNRGYVLELYQKYRRDPASVDAATRELFQQWTPPSADIDEAAPISGESLHKAVGAVNLAQSIRRYGHLAAQARSARAAQAGRRSVALALKTTASRSKTCGRCPPA